MNIKQAKEYIKNSVRLYLKKDEFGEYRVPVVRQRPMFLLGAPGIGKTAIMSQIAQELNIALVSYSMTHHTRQSALGLPFITHKVYGGKEYDVSEYTMSEIIATVYETMEESGIREGILFLDEINCVSETLAPSMLQFLQYKVFGRHRVPEGWVIVTAGNPPEYNKSVREFDVVTMDRLKVLEVEADFQVWKEYAQARGIHNAIVNYLDLKKEHFYYTEMSSKGRCYVTARGWEDLSEILFLYEEEGLPVDETLTGQYLRNERIVKEFTAYYDLYNKYKKDYCIAEILDGNVPAQAVARAREAAFDERLSLLGMLLDRLQADMKGIMEQAAWLSDVRFPLKAVKNMLESANRAAQAEAEQSGGKESAHGALEQSGGKESAHGASEQSGGKEAAHDTSEQSVRQETPRVRVGQVQALLERQTEGRRKLVISLQKANSLSDGEKHKHLSVIRFLEAAVKKLSMSDITDGQEAFDFLHKIYDEAVSAMKKETASVQKEIHSLFQFAEEAFDDGNEMLILVTELTVNSSSAQFIATFGSPDYQRHNQEMMLSERQNDIQNKIAGLEI